MNDDERSSARVSATLIITGDDLEPEIVTRALGIFPDKAWRAGEHAITKTQSGRFVTNPWPAERGGWKRYIPDDLRPESVEHQLSYWIEMLRGKKDRIHDFLAAGYTCKIDIFFLSPDIEVIQFESDLLLALGELGIDVVINIYAPNK